LKENWRNKDLERIDCLTGNNEKERIEEELNEFRKDIEEKFENSIMNKSYIFPRSELQSFNSQIAVGIEKLDEEKRLRNSKAF
jgi:lipase chaperone LimK